MDPHMEKSDLKKKPGVSSFQGRRGCERSVWVEGKVADLRSCLTDPFSFPEMVNLFPSVLLQPCQLMATLSTLRTDSAKQRP